MIGLTSNHNTRSHKDGMIRVFPHIICIFCMLLLATPFAGHAAKAPSLLHVSYDATREMLHEYNKAFIKKYQQEQSIKPRIRMSHGSSGKQARGVIDGLKADIISLALSYDIDAIAKRGLLSADWQNALPHHASPFYSTIVLLVRKGNPKHIQGWQDLTRADVAVLTPNPKTSGGARWGYLASWAYALKQYDNAKDREAFMCQWIKNVPFWDTAARAATTSFIRRKKGDVLITWENEAYTAQKYFGDDAFEIIIPTTSIRAEPKFAIIPKNQNNDAKNNLIKQYIDGLYAAGAQAIAAHHFFRPSLASADTILPPLKTGNLTTVEALGGFSALHEKHFKEGALFDRCTSAAYAQSQHPPTHQPAKAGAL